MFIVTHDHRFVEARDHYLEACEAKKKLFEQEQLAKQKLLEQELSAKQKLFDQERLLEQKRIDQKRMSARLKNVEYYELWRNQGKLGLICAFVLALGGIASHNLLGSAVQCDHDLCEQLRFDQRVTRRR